MGASRSACLRVAPDAFQQHLQRRNDGLVADRLPAEIAEVMLFMHWLPFPPGQSEMNEAHFLVILLRPGKAGDGQCYVGMAAIESSFRHAQGDLAAHPFAGLDLGTIEIEQFTFRIERIDDEAALQRTAHIRVGDESGADHTARTTFGDGKARPIRPEKRTQAAYKFLDLAILPPMSHPS